VPTADTAPSTGPQTLAPPPGSAALRDFERLLAELSSGFIEVEAECVDDAIEDALGRVARALDLDRCTLTSVSPVTGRIELTRSWSAPGVESMPPLDLVETHPWAVDTARSGRPVIFSRPSELPPEAAVDAAGYRRIGLTSHVTLPLFVAGRLRGGLSFGTLHRERVWPEALIGRMRLLADLFASVLGRRHAEQQRERALDFERLASRTLAALLIAGPRDEGRVIVNGLRDIVRVLGAERATVWELHEEDGRFGRAHFWFEEGAPGADRWSPDDLPWLSNRLERGDVMRIARLDELPSEAHADVLVLRGLGVRSLLAAPVKIGDRTLGVFTVVAERAESDWPEALMPGVRLLAEVFATLHARRIAERRERSAEAEAAMWRERLAHVARVHDVGEMSAALAHEFTQPLGAIENYALAARRRVLGPSADLGKVAELLDRIVAQSTRAGDVLARLRGMVRRHGPERGDVDLRRVVDACVELLRGEFERLDLRVEVSGPEGSATVFADEIHLQQVVLNLLRNAADAMHDASPAAPRLVRVTIGSAGHDALALQVDDHGPGIPESGLERVFEPFHSSKPLGLGVGLAICRRLVAGHGGTLRAARNPGGGARFELTMPRRPEGGR
jgi:signal transduction histidine kinase